MIITTPLHYLYVKLLPKNDMLLGESVTFVYAVKQSVPFFSCCQVSFVIYYTDAFITRPTGQKYNNIATFHKMLRSP